MNKRFKLMGERDPRSPTQDGVGAALREAFKASDMGDEAMQRLINQMKEIEGRGQ